MPRRTQELPADKHPGIRGFIKSIAGERRLESIRSARAVVRGVIPDREIAGALLKGKFNFGQCPICDKGVMFVRKGWYDRNSYVCLSCQSVPRQRAIIRVLEMLFPNWRELSIHESSPGGASSAKIREGCKDYTASHFFQDMPLGTYKDGYRCENLEKMTFPDEAFDLMITQDVMEHILHPPAAFAEIARILKPGGAHVFTVPYWYWKKTLVRAIDTPEGIKHLEPPDYHGNPVDEQGSLVVTEWGPELIDEIYQHGGMRTTVYNIQDAGMGLKGQFLDVLVSTKADCYPDDLSA